MRVFPGLHISRVVVDGEARRWPLHASDGRHWDFPHFAVAVGIRRMHWAVLPLGIRRYCSRPSGDRGTRLAQAEGN